MKDLFRRVAGKISLLAGSPIVFLGAFFIILTWALSGPVFSFSDTWQLVINTGTTIVTFLMVFLIQNTQNRDTRAMQLKLDELIRATKARDAFIDLEELTDDELDGLNGEFREFHAKQATSVVMRKLHAKIEAEHTRRQGVISSLDSIGHIFSKDKKHKS